VLFTDVLSEILVETDIDLSPYFGSSLTVTTPIDSTTLATLAINNRIECQNTIDSAKESFAKWRNVPAPKRGELVRRFGNILRKYKEPLARLVTIECGKILEESRGEVQEMIDICDFATGLSRQLHGLTISSERTTHTMQETWHPLGPTAIISAFNFPVAVWAWNAALALVCGNSIIWKPSEKTPLTAIICQNLLQRIIDDYILAPKHLSQILIGDRDIGNLLVEDKDIALVSATGSSNMGRDVGPKVANRFGKSLLELGGNNAVIITPSADLDIAIPAVVFGAVGTCGQRCTTTRRLFVHQTLIEDASEQLTKAYQNIIDNHIGNPMHESTLLGPLIDKEARITMQHTIKQAEAENGTVIFGDIPEMIPDSGTYVHPALVRMPEQTSIVKQETFAPILYVMPYNELSDVMIEHNAVPQGLSSAIFTTDLREAEYFKYTSDCGIANVNIGTSGAEIGGAFGGEKETGGGRESGSDAWKNYMRRQTSTTYFGIEKPELAQGISFD